MGVAMEKINVSADFDHSAIERLAAAQAALSGQHPGSQKLQVFATESENAEKLELVCHITSRVAHDLNNVLLVIDAYASMLLEELAGDTHLTAQATAIHCAGSRATKLVQELMALSQF